MCGQSIPKTLSKEYVNLMKKNWIKKFIFYLFYIQKYMITGIIGVQPTLTIYRH